MANPAFNINITALQLGMTNIVVIEHFTMQIMLLPSKSSSFRGTLKLTLDLKLTLIISILMILQIVRGVCMPPMVSKAFF